MKLPWRKEINHTKYINAEVDILTGFERILQASKFSVALAIEARTL